MKGGTALFVGKFNPFHKGHLEALKGILQNCDEVIIVVGSSQYSHELDQPFTAGERITMTRLALGEAGVDPSHYFIIPVPDVEAHNTWVSQVASYTPKFNAVYSNDPLTSRLFKESGFTVRSIPFYERDVYSATEVRRRMLKDEDWESIVPASVAEFIKEIDGVERLKDLAKTDKVQPVI
jgi:nicotinamide-nucleotide adenylyltransferase